MIPKDQRAYGTLFLRQEKSLRDHEMPESGMVPRVNADAGDMRVSAVQETEPAAGTESAGPRDSCLELVATFRYRLSLLVASVPGLRTRGSRGGPSAACASLAKIAALAAHDHTGHPDQRA